MIDRTHLNALEVRRSHEIGYIAQATKDEEIKLRQVWLEQIEKEIAREREFLGLPVEEPEDEMSIDEIFAELDAA